MKKSSIINRFNSLFYIILFLVAVPLSVSIFLIWKEKQEYLPQLEDIRLIEIKIETIKQMSSKKMANTLSNDTIPFLDPVKEDQLYQTSNELKRIAKDFLEPDSLSQLVKLTDQFENTLRTFVGVKMNYASQPPKEKDEATLNSLLNYGKELSQLYFTIQETLFNLNNDLDKKRQQIKTQLSYNQFVLFLVLGASLFLFLIAIIITIIYFNSSLKKPILIINETLLKFKSGNISPKDLVIENSPIPLLSETLQQQKIKMDAVQEYLECILADKTPRLSSEQIENELLSNLKQVQDRIKSLKNIISQYSQEIENLKNSYALKEEEQRRQIIKLNHRLQGVDSFIALAESDLQGKITYCNNIFAQWFEYQPNELLNQPFKILNSGYHEKDFFKDLWDTIQKGNAWKGQIRNKTKSGKLIWLAVSIHPIHDALGKITKYIFTALNIQDIKQNDEEIQNALNTTVKELENLKNLHNKVVQERDQIKLLYDEQKKLEYRLIQQQATLQEFTRNPDLKEGKIAESVRIVTESTCYTLDQDRVGFWLFNNDDKSLYAVDLFDRQNLQHVENLEIQEKYAKEFFEDLQQNHLLAVDDVLNHESTKRLSDYYYIPYNISSIIAAPVRLGGNVVGCLTIEHIGKPIQWAPDQVSFANAVADVLSMALEQGNRKVMEEELRTALEESQALEEELRQNAEEIEATNEELRRAQIELKGQIEALNSAAIVSETNVNGFITYVNSEFLQIYNYHKEEVFGKNHRILKSGEHPPEFYKEMWDTILKGRVWKGEIKNKSKDGWYYWINLTITPVIGSDGKPYKFIAVGFNISSQKLQEEQLKTALEVALQQEEMLRENTEELLAANEEMRRTQVELIGQISALNNSSMVFETDMEGNITYVNSELLITLNYEKEELLGRRYTVLKSPNQSDRIYQEQWKSILNGRIWEGEIELRAKDGHSVWVWMTNTPVLDSDGEPIKSINVLFDITAQKEQEFRLKKQQAALLEVTSHPAVKEAKTEEAFAIIAQIGLATLEVDRASIWIFEENETRIRCMTTAQADGVVHKYQKGTVLQRDFYPNYFRTLEKDRVIAAVDAVNDPRTKELSIPLLVPSGIQSVLDSSIRQGMKTVGILSFESRSKQRNWTLDEQNFATSLADTIVLVLEQHERLKTDKLKEAYAQLELINQEVIRQKEEIEENAKSLTESIKYAKRIQQNILPSKEFLNSLFTNYFVIFRPRDIVGGDFYWVSGHETKRVIVVADGTGHGVPGAFLTMIGNILLNQIVNEKKILRPADILYWLHIGVRQTLKQDAEDSTSRDGMDVTLVVYDTETYECQYAGANLPCNYYQDWEVHEIKPDKQSIGGEQMEEERIFTNHQFQLKPGDAIYLYTDGFVDQLGGPDEKRFSTRRFRDLILRTQTESMATQRALLNMEWKEWKGDLEQLDDVTVFGLRL